MDSIEKRLAAIEPLAADIFRDLGTQDAMTELSIAISLKRIADELEQARTDRQREKK